ncbi:hypothetical protein A3842_11785 [Paenibacillus sp. P3E]|uniref:hypothetical protein n=1 Tax=Paenibacillus sp. P3E TaxID=1349435 RepID=UPI00093EA710|nr:hypothetical protein [Paenibacillus sp. P3E]OKP80574.1 hypothetical protein A3842_11785 [Paenibacillus sp. P3E]
MKKTMMKAIMAATMLISTVAGQWEISNANAAAATPAPIIRDNLFKFGLKKEVELPVTITSGGFSYTLEKLMIYDVNSNDAQALMKKYGYIDRLYKTPTKYMVWTKITIENKSKKIVQRNAKDQQDKWFLCFDGYNLNWPAPIKLFEVVNSKEALNTWVLKPGEKLTTYQMYGDFKKPTDITIYTNIGGGFDQKIIVKE